MINEMFVAEVKANTVSQTENNYILQDTDTYTAHYFPLTHSIIKL